MTDDDTYAAALEELAALKTRLRALEAMAAEQAPPEPKPDFNDALRQLNRTGSATGPGVDRLRRDIEGRSTPPAAPAAPLGGSPALAEAERVMRANSDRRLALELAAPGASGRVDVLGPAADRLDQILKGR